jgi:hypothetical protein
VFCTILSLWVNFLANKKIKQAMQQVNAAKKSAAGKSARRVMDMLLRSSQVGPAYAMAAKAAKPKKKSNKNKSPSSSVSMCVGKMLYASCNPFHQNALGSCIPDGSASASVRGFARKQITVTIGTAGVGFCLVFPSLANDAPAFAFTGPTFIGTELSWLVGNTTLRTGVFVETLPTNCSATQLCSGWSAQDDRPAFASRIVGCGLTFRYTGKEVDRAGQAFAYIHPQHSSSASTVNSAGVEVINSQSDLAQYVETFIIENSREETFIPIMPISAAELAYSNEQDNNRTQVVYPFSQGAEFQPIGFIYTNTSGALSYQTGIPTCSLMFTGTPGSTVVINYGQHTETIGVGVNAYSRMPAESDPVGVQDLQSAFARFVINRQRVPGRDTVSEFKKAVASIQNDRGRRMAL